MIVPMLVSPVLTVLACAALVHVVWRLAGDFLLEHVGVPVLDAGCSRENAWAMRPVTTLDNGGTVHGEGESGERRQGVREAARDRRGAAARGDAGRARPDCDRRVQH